MVGAGEGGRGAASLSYDPKLVNLPDICYLKKSNADQQTRKTVSKDFNPLTACRKSLVIFNSLGRTSVEELIENAVTSYPALLQLSICSDDSCRIFN